MTQQALRELVALAEEATPYHRAGELVVAVKAALPHLKALLGEQREAQGAERPQGEIHALPHSPPPVPEVLAPVYRFLIGRCLYWKLLIGDDAELPEAPWYGIVQIQIKRSGKLEYCEAKYEAPLFGGPPQWSSWNASEGNYEVLKWLKQWNLPIDVAPPLAESVGEMREAIKEAADQITRECGGSSGWVESVITKHLSRHMQQGK